MGKWTMKYKKSINCKRPKGFSQKQYCKGKKLNIVSYHTNKTYHFNFVNGSFIKLKLNNHDLDCTNLKND
jgi:uncharacterized protein